MKRFTLNIILILAFLVTISAITVLFIADIKFNSAGAMDDAYRWNRADALYNEAVCLNPYNTVYLTEYAEFIINRGLYYKDKDALAKAEKLYERALLLNPECAKYEIRLGQLDIEKDPSGSAGPAMRRFRRAIKDDPNGFYTAYQIGYSGIRLWSYLGDDDKELVLGRLSYALWCQPWQARYIYPEL